MKIEHSAKFLLPTVLMCVLTLVLTVETIGGPRCFRATCILLINSLRVKNMHIQI
jgi:hypothetical protein